MMELQWGMVSNATLEIRKKNYNIIILITLNPPVPPLQYPHTTAT